MNIGSEQRVNIRNATPDDIAGILKIESEGSARWKRDFFETELNTDFSLFLVALMDETIIGFAVAWDIPGEIQLQNIAVDKDYRREGCGTKLIESIYRLLEHKHPERILLELRISNIPALKFYRSLGFKKTGIRKNYYGDGDDALLMEKEIIK